MTAKTTYQLDAVFRETQGKGASRRLRRMEDKVPAILYGGNEDPIKIALDQKKMMHALENPGFYSHILTLHLPNKKQQVLLKDLQRHHYKKSLLHIDFLRVSPNDVIHMRVPIHFSGATEAPGVVDGSGIVLHRMNDLDVKCQVKDLPEAIEIDLSKMQLDQTLHISDLKLPKGVESVALSHGPDHDLAVVSIHLPRAAVEETEETATEAAAETAAPASAVPTNKDVAAAAKAKEKGK
jgi:large subunit ribosomal protein L25